MATHFLCPIDFSAVSSQAVEQAVVLARQSGARLTALHVFRSVMPATGLTELDAATSQVIEPADLQALHDRVADACRPALDAGVAVDIVVIGGAPVEVILDQAAALPADLIVMGTHGASGFQRLVLGSVTEKVLRRAVCPVLTVPPRASRAAGAFRQILCAVDFSECSTRAVEAALVVAGETGTTLVLVHVLEWPWHEPPVPGFEGVPPEQVRALLDYRRYLETTAMDALKRLAGTIRAAGDVVTLVRVGKPYVELLDAARELNADLIALGVQGRGAIDLGLFGSTAHQVIRRAACPVLTVGGKATR
jgi:nucleotide-binding universal stress UspA family protein